MNGCTEPGDKNSMKRRDFLKTAGAVVASTALPDAQLFAEGQLAAGRMILPMNRNWCYQAAKVDGAESVNFDDAKFDQVTIPHTNVELPWHSFDEKDYAFVSTYRRKFKLPEGTEGKRIFVDFEGAMTASTVWINGVRLGEYKGGFTPFSFELTQHVHRDVENVLCVQLDSSERPEIPPFGYEIDYLTFGGIYREVSLRVVPHMYIDNIFAQCKDVLSSSPSLDVSCFLAGDAAMKKGNALEVELRDGDQTIAKARRPIETMSGGPKVPDALDPYTDAAVYATTETLKDPSRHQVSLTQLGGIKLWSLEDPHLYSVHVRLLSGDQVIDEDMRRVGFREATFTDHGFSLNGKIVKLRGLDRHQTFPFVGQAMAARGQRKDADILRKNLHCNIVRTSHYPQSRYFLDRCDEIGLLVLEEIPGWQHIGDESWKQVAIDNVGRMIRRDWNHPSIILWGVRINESQDDHDFYTRTNALAHALDDSRQTGGIRYFQSSEFLEDVFTMNDFGWPLKPPNHSRYLNTEFVGHTYPTKTIDQVERLTEHTIRHARVHDQLASNPQYAGGIGWCAFDYNTHGNFGSGDRICYHGVTDIFREPKPAAGFYKSQCDPAEEIVLEPAFHWARGDQSIGFSKAVVCSNCDHLKNFIADHLVAEVDPDRKQFPHLKYAPFVVELGELFHKWGDLRLEGYIEGKQVIVKNLSGDGVDKKFALLPDDTALLADGADSTRVVLRVTDEFDRIRPFANDSVKFKLEGPAELIGDNPYSLIGGTGAVWVRAKEQPGRVRLTATHPQLGTQTVEIEMSSAPPEKV